jgi:uncharacterized protein (TIGR02118 family)
MIHQLVFAHPRLGMTDKEFGDYWVHEHAARYLSRIPQIRRLVVTTKLPFGPEPADPPWSGVAEIWTDDDSEQLAAWQSREYIEGVRRDEPNWAAFWRTLVLDTDGHEWAAGDPLSAQREWVKAFWVAKRRPGVPLAMARTYALKVHMPFLTALPGVRRVVQGHVRDSAYQLGEAPLDFVFQTWFDSLDALGEAVESSQHQALLSDRNQFCEPRWNQQLVGREHWVIGPQPR